MATQEEEALREAERRVSAAVEQEGFAPAAITVARTEGPAGTTRVRAVAAGAYPGSGVAVALVRGATIYGPRGGLAALARALGWYSGPVEAATAVAIANDLLWSGLAGLDADEPARLGPGEGGGLRLELVRRLLPSGAREALQIELPLDGDERVSPVAAGAAPAPPTPPTPIDRATALLRALDEGRLAEALQALGAIDAPRSPRELLAIARAAAASNDALAADALLKLGPGEPAAEALRAALSSAPPARRAAVRAMAEETWGAAFAGRLG